MGADREHDRLGNVAVALQRQDLLAGGGTWGGRGEEGEQQAQPQEAGTEERVHFR